MSSNRLLQWIQAPMVKPMPVLMWFVTLVFVFYQFILQLSSGIIIPPLIESFKTSALGASIVSSSYYYVYVTLQTPAGLLLDHYGIRRVLSSGAIVCVFGCFLFASSQTLYMAELGRILMGAGCAFAFVSSLEIAALWFPPKRFGLMVGLADSIGSIGSTIGNIGFAYYIQAYGWRAGMNIAGILAIFIAALCIIFIVDKKVLTYKRPFMDSLREVICSRSVWINGIYTGLSFSVVTVFAAVWGIPYVAELLSVDYSQATVVCSMTMAGVTVGSPFMGWVYSRLEKVRLFLAINILLCAVIIEFIVELPQDNIVNLGILFFILGFWTSAYVICYALVNNAIPSQIRGTAMGFTNMLCTITAPIMAPVIGWGLDHAHWLHAHAVTTHYDLFDFRWALRLLPLTLLIGVVIVWYLPIHEEPEQRV